MIKQTPTVASLLLLTDDDGSSSHVAAVLARAGAVHVSRLGDAIPPATPYSLVFVDIDLLCQKSIKFLRSLLGRNEFGGATRLFLVDHGDYRGARQAEALGADRICERPLAPQAVLGMLRTQMASGFRARIDGIRKTKLGQGLLAAHGILEGIFDGDPAANFVKPKALGEAAEIVADSLQEEGLASWLEVVASHHSSSYRHTLLVAATATSFALHIGANRREQARIARASLMHDVGKARIPLYILDKPGKLDAAEEAEARRHPELGVQMLSERGGFCADTLRVVGDHHEMCDGSGYPRGVAGAEIDDLTRMVTIADIFSALIEERAYKPAFSHAKALAILHEMGPKLDRDLVGVFARMIRSQCG